MGPEVQLLSPRRQRVTRSGGAHAEARASQMWAQTAVW